jgi:hypothetical protein
VLPLLAAMAPLAAGPAAAALHEDAVETVGVLLLLLLVVDVVLEVCLYSSDSRVSSSVEEWLSAGSKQAAVHLAVRLQAPVSSFVSSSIFQRDECLSVPLKATCADHWVAPCMVPWSL